MVKTYDCTSGGAQWCQGCYTMTEQPDFLGKRQGEWVSLEDYEKLEAALLQERNGPIVCVEHRWGNACPWCALHANNAEIERLRGIVSHQDAKLVEGQSQSETSAEHASYLKTRDCEHEWLPTGAYIAERCSKCSAGRLVENKGEQG